jgi:hypothetical protein
MKTKTTYLQLYKDITKNSTSQNEQMGLMWLNESARTVGNINKGTWRWLERSDTILTVASQGSYQIPNKFRKVMSTYIQLPTSNGVIYRPLKIYSEDDWELILQSKLGESDTVRFQFIDDKARKISYQPVPQTTGNEIKIRGRVKITDITRDDYTAGTIQAVANGGTTVTGNATSWNTSMIGSWIRITQTSATVSGDGLWYEIAGVSSTTSLTLLKPYEGTTIAAATLAYTIGQTYPIPEEYDMAPLYRALALYWDWQRDQKQSERYWMLYDGGNEIGISEEVGGIIGQMLEEEGETFEGPYISPNKDLSFDPNNPQPVAPSSAFI